jgi:hypothetical protein
MKSRIVLTGILCFFSGLLVAQKMTVKDSNANVLMEVNDEGTVGSITVLSGSAPGVTTNKLYNVSGVLYWNGTALAAGGASGWTDDDTIVRLTTAMDMVGIGTSSPEFKLSLDDDGGIIAKGIFGSGATLITSGAGPRLIWYPRKSAFRAGEVMGSQWDETNIGENSIAMGWNTIASSGITTAFGQSTTASGLFSTSMGSGTTASGGASVAMGYNTKSSGECSTAMGTFTTAAGNHSTAMGYSTSADSYISMAIGRHNVGGGTAVSWVTTDPVFEIGIGADGSNKANAVTVLKSGNVGIGVATPGQKLEVNGKTLTSQLQVGTSTTTGYVLTADASGNATWQAASEGGWTDDGTNVYTTASSDKVGIGTSTPEFKLSLDTDGGILAKGTYEEGNTLPTLGGGTRLIWYPRKAAFRAGYVDGTQWDDGNIGDYSTAMGTLTTASGTGATALGYGTTSSGSGTTSMGIDTKAESRCSVAMGKFNVGGGSPTGWNDTDPLFEIGIGTGSLDKKNAVTVLKNGKVGIGTGKSSPTYLLDMDGGGYYNSGTGQWVSVSSRESKQDIRGNSMDAQEILDQVQLVNFRYRNEVKENSDAPYHIGFIAEDTPELLSGKNHDGIYMSDCISLLIAVVKEQQKRIEALEAMMNESMR